MMVMVGSWLRRMTARLRRLLGRPRIPGRLRLGGTGGAQVRLELAAEVMREFALELRRTQPPQTDREALLQGLRNRACGGCVLRAGCLERKQLSVKDLEEGTAFPCRKPGRLGRELREARRSLRRMEAQRRRESECLGALEEQYLFLEEYLRRLADRLPRGAPARAVRFGVRAGIRTRRKPPSAATGGRPFPEIRDGSTSCCATAWGWAPGPGRTAAGPSACCGSCCWRAIRPGTPCGASTLCWLWKTGRGR